MANIFILDDDPAICEMLTHQLKLQNHNVAVAFNLEQGIESLSKLAPDVVFLDVCLPDGNGLLLIPRIRQLSSNPEVIIITGQGDPDGAEIAIRNGAWDYIEKPSTISRMMLPMLRALDYRKEKAAQTEPLVLKREKIIGNSSKIIECLELVGKAAKSSANVLITGESGTGKELFARAIHDNSHRNDRRIIIIDCTSLPENLAESILFGHEKGAFTGATTSQQGLIYQADGGTLFLDEIGELPLTVQKKFLRVLQEHRFRPIGSKTEKKSDFRLIAATNRNLEDLVTLNRFREDLLFRLSALSIYLPPLRDHPEDIREIFFHYMTKICDRDHNNIKGITPEFFKTLETYQWPGNVRELINTAETAITLSQNDQTLFIKHLPINIRVKTARQTVQTRNLETPEIPTKTDINNILPFAEFKAQSLNTVEMKYIVDLLTVSNNNISDAMQFSGLSRSRLYGIMKKHNISVRK